MGVDFKTILWQLLHIVINYVGASAPQKELK